MSMRPQNDSTIVPMSASNLPRIELGSQGPPADEIIERIGLALIPRGAFGEQPCLYSVLVTIRNR